MCGYGYGQANPAIKKWRNNRYFGRKLMHFSRSNYGREKVQVVPDISYIVRNEEGIYGFVGGGTNNIGSFINWCAGLGSWCFNPWVDKDEYVWSDVNQAYMHKSKSGLRQTPIFIGKFYKADFDSADNLIRLYSYEMFNNAIVWEKEE
jgi:hypothetical protein